MGLGVVVGVGLVGAMGCRSWLCFHDSCSDPLGDGGDDSVSADFVAAGFGDDDWGACVVYAVLGVVVWPSHESFAFKWGEFADHPVLCLSLCVCCLFHYREMFLGFGVGRGCKSGVLCGHGWGFVVWDVDGWELGDGE